MTARAGGALLEREAELALLGEQLDRVKRTGRGRVVFLAGEAGVGKTALVRAFCDRQPLPAIEGACAALFTARPLGPFLDVAADLGGELEALMDGSPAPADVVRALAQQVRRPHIVVLEDLHWADEATLDVLRLLIRRVRTMPALVIATFRDDEAGPAHPLRRVLGESSGGETERVSVEPLSASAVAELASESEIDGDRLHATTGGNAFFVTEVLAAGDVSDPPATVRDAVHARVARLDASSRRLLEAIAIVPPRCELWLLEAVTGADFAQIGECLDTGVVRSDRDAVAFRHELARTTIEEDLAPDRALALHRAVLAALEGRADPARLAHHAEAAQDHPAAHTHALAGAQRAASLGAHHEAVAQYERALRHALSLTPAAEANLLEKLSYEHYLTGRIDAALSTGAAALARYRELAEPLRQGDALRWMSRLAWTAGDKRRATEHGVAAIRLLEPLPPGRELAMAYSNASQLRMLASDVAGTLEWGERAIALSERLGETQILAHALINVGSAAIISGRSEEGWSQLERSRELAETAGLEDEAVRAHLNAAGFATQMRDLERAAHHLEAGIAYCLEHDLDGYHHYLLGWRALYDLQRGHWDAAGETAAAAAGRTGMAPVNRIMPLVVLGLLRARRGVTDVWGPLDEARALAERTGELVRLAPVAAARAEARWLSGERQAIADETDELVALTGTGGPAWLVGDVCLWRIRAGLPVPDVKLPAPHRVEQEGELTAAAQLWAQLGCPYESAMALSRSDQVEELRVALADLQRLGAAAAAAIVARRLRERGALDISLGPRRSTPENPAGLTARQLEVLTLLADGASNADVAARLFLSEKTVSHHVSAILSKLDARSRGEAVAVARRLGLLSDVSPT